MAPRRLLPLAILAAALCAAPAACRREAPDRTAPAPSPERRYTIRGEVLRLPGAGGPRQVLVRHEAIPNFVDRAGAVTGMQAMAMAFDVAPAVPLEGVSVGDKIEATLAVDWSRPSLRLEELRRLPPDTVLRIGRAPEEMPHHGGDAGRATPGR